MSTMTDGPALAAYDWVLTIQLEVDEVWKQKVSRLTILYLVNRYTLLASAVLVCLLQLHPDGGDKEVSRLL